MLQELLARVRAFLMRDRHEADLQAELRDHLEREIARNIERGLPPDEARHAAHLAIGNLTTHNEDGRAATTGVWFEQLAQDARYAARTLRRNPGFAVVAILSLGFGIGATTTVFSTIDAIDFRPLPFHDPDRLVWLAEVAPSTDDVCAGCASRVSAATAIDWLGQARSYAAAGAMAETVLPWVHNDAIEQVPVNQATPGFFRFLGVAPALGRDFLSSDTLPGAPPVVIVTQGFWRQRLAGDAAAIGRALPSSTDPGTDARLRGAIIIGVLPETFRFNVTRDRQVWMPLRLPATSKRTARSVTVIARLQRGASVSSASAELRAIFARLVAAYPTPYRSWSARVEPLRARLGWGAGGNRRLVFGITSLVLLVAVVNVAGLLAGRASARRQEFAMRSAFGASRRRLVRQLLVEGSSVGLGGGLVGALIASWGVRFSSRWFGVDTGVAIVDLRVLSFALVLSLVVGIVTAVGPAFRISRVDVIGDLRGKGSAVMDRRTRLASNALIIAQVALGLILLTAAASLSADFVTLRYADLGFVPSGLYATYISGPRPVGQDATAWRDEAEAVRARVAAIPGVRVATLEYVSAMHPEIVRPSGRGDVSSVTPVLKAVDPTYFETWGMRLLRGRAFGPADGAGAARVAIVNRSAAARFWPGQDPVGRQIFVGDSGAPGELLTVIGESVDAERGELIERHWPMVYRPLAQATLWHTVASLQIRIDGRANRAALLALAQSGVREVLQRPADPFRSAEAELNERLRARRLTAIAFDLFALFGLALAAMGVYGAIAAAVTRRTREIGVRIALGAAPGGTLRLVVRRGVALALAGVALGLLGAGAVARVLRSLVAGTDALDPRVFAAAAAVMIVTAVAAALVPARRVLRVDPVEALRAD
jgi:putative ABC transport system permease protein